MNRYGRFEGGMIRASDGDWMRVSEVLEFIRQLEDTLPDYTERTYDNDQVCDIFWVKTRLQEELG